MNYLTGIRQSYTRLQLAYDCAQKGPRGKREALLLVDDAEKKLQAARLDLQESIAKEG